MNTEYGRVNVAKGQRANELLDESRPQLVLVWLGTFTQLVLGT